MDVNAHSWTAGQPLNPLSLPPLSRTTLALYAAGSGDHNPLHLDIDFARSAGMPDVIGHGMLTMALLGRYVTNLAPQVLLRTYAVRFLDMARVGDAITCTGSVQEVADSDRERVLTLQLVAARLDGTVLASGRATIAVPRTSRTDV